MTIKQIITDIQTVPFTNRLPGYTYRQLADIYQEEKDNADDCKRLFRQLLWRLRKGNRKWNIPKLNNVEIGIMAKDLFSAYSSA